MIIVMMGVSGCGKTTLGERLADALGFAFAEGDEYHPPRNVAKMRRGVALDDADRWPWLDTLAGELGRWRDGGQGVVLACSALKRAYRERLLGGARDVRLVYLRAPREVIAQRLAQRRGHYMPAALLDSQFAALQEPGPEERAIVVEVGAATPQAAVADLRRRLGTAGSKPRPAPGE